MQCMRSKNFPTTSFLMILICGLFFCTNVFAVNAELAPDNTIPTSTTINVHQVPLSPKPNENVVINITSYSENLNSSTIEWFLNGKIISSGIGIKSITIQAPDAGNESVVTIKINSQGTLSQASTTIHPTIMDLLVEATDSYVPPFYKGKALPATDSFIKVVAMPDIRTGTTVVNPTNLTYVWQKDFTNAQSESGYGKNYFIYRNLYFYDRNTIGVTASTIDEKYTTQALIEIIPVEPSLSFYKEDISLGILWNKTLESPHNIGTAESIVAIPYFISPKDIRKPDLNFNWTINNVPITVSNIYFTHNILPLKVEDGISGSSNLRLTIDNIYKYFQSTSGTLYLKF